MNPVFERSPGKSKFANAFKMPAMLIVCMLVAIPEFAQPDIKNIPVEEIKVSKKTSKNANKIIYGLASYYAQKFHGRQTANGEIFSHQAYTAACNVLPLGTWIQVTNLKNGKVIVVRTNDRLHPKTRRILDLTYTAANKLGFIKSGLTRVKIEILDQKKYKKPGKK